MPSTGILGLQMLVLTVAHHEVEDPIEAVVRKLTESKLKFIISSNCDQRDDERKDDKETLPNSPSLHIRQLGLTHSVENQAIGLEILKNLQLEFAAEAIESSQRIIASISLLKL